MKSREYWLSVHFMNRQAETFNTYATSGFNAIMKAGFNYEAFDDEITAIKIKYIEGQYDTTPYIDAHPLH